jgi:hypothetical protein
MQQKKKIKQNIIGGGSNVLAIGPPQQQTLNTANNVLLDKNGKPLRITFNAFSKWFELQKISYRYPIRRHQGGVQEGLRVESDQPKRSLAPHHRLGHPVDGCRSRTEYISENQTSLKNQSLPRNVLDSEEELPGKKPQKDEEVISERLQVLPKDLASPL